MPDDPAFPRSTSSDDAFDLLPRDVWSRMPALYGREAAADPVVHVRLFFPAGCYTAYLIEGENGGTDDEPEWLAFAFVVNMVSEFGYVRLAKLEALNLGGLRVERDLWFTPCKLSLALRRDGHPAHRNDLND